MNKWPLPPGSPKSMFQTDSQHSPVGSGSSCPQWYLTWFCTFDWLSCFPCVTSHAPSHCFLGTPNKLLTFKTLAQSLDLWGNSNQNRNSPFPSPSAPNQPMKLGAGGRKEASWEARTKPWGILVHLTHGTEKEAQRQKEKRKGRILGARKERDLAVLVSSGKATQKDKDENWNPLTLNNFINNDYLQNHWGMMRSELDF